MAQKLNDVTPDIKPPDISNPDGSYLDKTVSVVGSPTLAGIANSLYSFFSALMVFTGTTYNGQVDTTALSQYFNALGAFVNTKITGITDPLAVRVTDNEGDIDDLETRMTNTESATGTNSTNISNNDTDISNLQGRATALETKTPQSYTINDTVTFADVVLLGYASVKDTLISLLSRMSNTESATGTNSTDIDDLETRMSNTESATGTNSTDIDNLEGRADDLEEKTPQSYKTNDDVVFNKVEATSGFIPNTNTGSINTSTIGGVVLFEKGFYNIELKVSSSGLPGGAATIYLERFIDGAWREIDNVVAPTTGTTYRLTVKGMQGSGGSDLRIRLDNTGPAVPTATAVYSKY